MSVIAFDFYAENDPNGTALGTLDDADCKAMEFRVALHELGAGRFTISRHHVDASLVAENRLVKVRIPSVSANPIFAFWLKEGDFTLIDSNEQGGEDLTFGGPGVLYMLALARLQHTSQVYDQPARGSTDRPGLWTWINEPWGAILTRIIEEGRQNPFPDAAAVGSPLEDVTITFDRTTDSDSVAWPTITEEFTERIGTDMLQVAERLREAGDLFLRMDPNLAFHAHQTYGRNLAGAFGAGTVRFQKGTNILTQLTRRIGAREQGTHLILEDSEGNYSTEVLSGYTTAQRAHYLYYAASQTNDDTLLNAIGADVLRRSRTSVEALELEVTPGFAPASGRYMPGPAGTSGHFWVGDTVTLHTGTGTHDYNAAPQVVTAIRVVLDEAADDSTSDTAARSLHIVPELNYEAVRSMRWGDKQGPNASSHTHLDHLCRPGTPPIFRDAAVGDVGTGIGRITVPSGLTDAVLFIKVGRVLGKAWPPTEVYWRPTSGTGTKYPATLIGSVNHPDQGGIALYYVANPVAGTLGDFGTGDNPRWVGAWLWSNVNQTTPVPEFDTGTGTGTATSGLAVTEVAGSAYLSAVNVDWDDSTLDGPTAPVAGAGMISNWAQVIELGSPGFRDMLTGGGYNDPSPSWSFNQSQPWAGFAARIAGSSAGDLPQPIGGNSEAAVGTSTRQARCDHVHAHSDQSAKTTETHHHASSVKFTPTGTIAATDVQAAIAEAASEGAPTTADYLVGTAQAGLSAEIVVGTSPGGELGGTWASPTVDTVHSGSAHPTEASDLTTLWRPLMAQDPSDSKWYVVVDGDGTAVMVESTP